MTVITRAPTSDEYTSGGWTGGWADVDDYPDQVSTMSGTVYTAAAWTVADVNGSGSNPLQAFGIQVTDNTPTIQIASIQLEVEYTEGAPAGTARSQVIIIGG